jgi:hypothetical protein
MEETLNYKELYSLQDKILKIVFSRDTLVRDLREGKENSLVI